MKKPRMCANGLPRFTPSGQRLYTLNACTQPALTGHIHCEPCRREQGGYYVRAPRIVEKDGSLQL